MGLSKAMKRTRRGAMLVAVLLSAQLVALGHVDTAESHPGSEPCVVCASLASMGTANVGASQLIVAPFRHEHLRPTTAIIHDSIPAYCWRARGPPLTS